ncbi:MAG: hypothetical protein P8X98_17175, partial [Woeseiaceae bacterium]
MSLALAAPVGAAAAEPAVASSAGAGGVTDAAIAASPGKEWLSYGGGYEEQRYSPLNQISDAN